MSSSNKRRHTKMVLTGADPNGREWAGDQSRFGFRMLQQMGWRGDGSGLGKDQQGHTEHVKVKVKFDARGVGTDAQQRRVQKEALGTKVEAFGSLLDRLRRQHAPGNSAKDGGGGAKGGGGKGKDDGKGDGPDSPTTPDSPNVAAVVGRNRMVFRRRLQSKMASNYSQQDMAAILGQSARKTHGGAHQPATARDASAGDRYHDSGDQNGSSGSSSSSDARSSSSGSDEEGGGSDSSAPMENGAVVHERSLQEKHMRNVQYTSTMDMHQYFRMKMAQRRSSSSSIRRSNKDIEEEEEEEEVAAEEVDMNSKKRKKVKCKEEKKTKEEVVEADEEEEGVGEERKKKRKKSKKSNKSKKEEKKRKHKKRMREEETESDNEKEEEVLERSPKKKKKSKKEKKSSRENGRKNKSTKKEKKRKHAHVEKGHDSSE